MKRIKLTVAYDGTDYSGWQIQPRSDTIELQLDRAIYRVSSEQLHVTGASRTDAGVHAMGNVAVFDTDSTIPGDRWAYALNATLPDSIRIMESREVSADFHPRHCNTEKTYEYKILNTQFGVPQQRNYTWHINQSLNIEKMQEAANLLVGEHDFKSFCCVRTTVESTVRTIYSIEVLSKPFMEQPQPDYNEKNDSDQINKNNQNNESDQNNDSDLNHLDHLNNLITIRVRGNGFLYNMVRIIAGTLVAVGKGQKTVSDIEKMLNAKDRCSAGQTAPPQGLTLMRINYVDGDDKNINHCG